MSDDLRDRLQSALGDQYHLEREIGGGGMSRVFVAEEKALTRKVVVKVLPPDLDMVAVSGNPVVAPDLRQDDWLDQVMKWIATLR